jgi:tripartite-type tricarboxylate transporter receptor subunit TctC
LDMKGHLTVIAAAALAAAIPGAQAQTYPVRPVTIVVPFAAGGPNDTFARILAERMRVSLGQPVVIENIGGAGGVIGVGRVARATPDGYTLSFGSLSSHVLNGGLMSLPYDVVNDFAPIAMAIDGPQLLVGRKSLPANDLKELLAWLKANPDKATLGHPGNGSAAHVAGAFMMKEILSARALSRRRTGDAGRRRRPDRPDDDGRDQFRAANPLRLGQAVRGHGQEPDHGGA